MYNEEMQQRLSLLWEKILPMKDIRLMVTKVRGTATVLIPPGGDYFAPISETIHSRVPGIGLGDITLTLTRAIDYFGEETTGCAPSASSAAESSGSPLCLFLVVIDKECSYQVEQELFTGPLAAMLAYLKSDRLIEDLKKCLGECSDTFARQE